VSLSSKSCIIGPLFHPKLCAAESRSADEVNFIIIVFLVLIGLIVVAVGGNDFRQDRVDWPGSW
jgi:hypothetical protein